MTTKKATSKRELTRARVIQAAIECIERDGFHAAHTNRIAEEAGVSWGVLQYHFGDKDGILMAALQASFDRFAERLADVPAPDASLEARVSLFVERSWEHFASAHYRSTFEILLNLPADLEPSWQSVMLDAWSGIWSRYFPGSRASARRTVDLMHYTISVLTGLASTRMLEGSAPPVRTTELGFLKDTLWRELSRDG